MLLYHHSELSVSGHEGQCEHMYMHIKGCFLYHLKMDYSQIFCQVADPKQVECLFNQILSVDMSKASRNSVLFISNLGCSESLQMA